MEHIYYNFQRDNDDSHKHSVLKVNKSITLAVNFASFVQKIIIFQVVNNLVLYKLKITDIY